METVGLLAALDELAGEVADFALGLLGLLVVWAEALGAFVGCEDEVFGFGFDCAGVEDVAVDAADVLAEEGVAFAHLRGGGGS